MLDIIAAHNKMLPTEKKNTRSYSVQSQNELVPIETSELRQQRPDGMKNLYEGHQAMRKTAAS